MSRIALDGVTKRFADDTVAVRSLTLDVADGELMVLVGPSGCGKTTVLRMVAGLEEVTDGTISIDGQVVNDLDPRHRDIAMVFQSYALYPHLSVYDNMAFSLKYRRTPKTRSTPRDRCRADPRARTLLAAKAHASCRVVSASASPWDERSFDSPRLPYGRAAVEPRRQAARRRCGPRSSRSSNPSRSRRST